MSDNLTYTQKTAEQILDMLSTKTTPDQITIALREIAESINLVASVLTRSDAIISSNYLTVKNTLKIIKQGINEIIDLEISQKQHINTTEK